MMPILGPTNEDVEKIHLEVNQIVNQRLVLTSLAPTIFGVMASWIVSKPASDIKDLGLFIYLIPILILAVLLILFFLTYNLSKMLRIFSTYLDVNSTSNWEKDWANYRKHFFYLGYTKSQAIIFFVLGLASTVFPFLLVKIFSLSEDNLGTWLCISFGIVYEVIVVSLGFLGWFGNEKAYRNNWKSLIPIYGIAFDLEGTIIDVEELHHNAHLMAAENFGVKLTRTEAIHKLNYFIGGPDEKVASEIASIYKKDFPIKDYLARKDRYFLELMKKKKELSPREGFLEFFNWAKAANIKLIIGTVSSRERAINLLKMANLYQEFGEFNIVSRDEVAIPKPSPDVFIETAHRLNIRPINQLVIEDSVVGVKAAVSADSQIIAIPTTDFKDYHNKLIRAGAGAVFSSWLDPNLKTYILGRINK